MDHIYRNQAAAAYLSLYFFIFSFSPVFKHWKFASYFSQELWGLEGWNLIHTWTVDSGIVFNGIRLLLLIHPFISSVFFLSNFQTLKIFVAFISGTVSPIKLKLDTHVDIGWMYRVYRNQAATSYLPLISLFFFLSNVQKLYIFVTLLSGTVRPRKFKLGTLDISGWMYHVHQNQAAATYLSLYFFIFLSLQLSNINIFRHTFLRTVRPRKLKLGKHVDNQCMYRVYRN